MVAAPSDQDIQMMWLFLGIAVGIVAVFVGAIFLALVTDRYMRRSPFNVYLLFLIFPDFLFSFACTFTCLRSFFAGHYLSLTECHWQTWYA